MDLAIVFLADGFEEIEALTTVDVLRRAGLNVVTMSIGDSLTVRGAHGVKVLADAMFDADVAHNADWLIVPGGMPGATNLAAHVGVCDALVQHNKRGGLIAAICASPAVVLGPLGILSGRDAVCYPGMEKGVSGVHWGAKPVIVSDNIVTGNGPSAATEFALTVVALSVGEDAAAEVASAMLTTFPL